MVDLLAPMILFQLLEYDSLGMLILNFTLQPHFKPPIYWVNSLLLDALFCCYGYVYLS